jgi:two-component system, sensor histidine kinase
MNSQHVDGKASRPPGVKHSGSSIDLREEMLRSFCHDLTQPLCAAILRAAALRRQLQEHRDIFLLADLEESLFEINSLSESVFESIRLSRDDIKVNETAVSVCRVANRVRSSLEHLATSRKLELRVRTRKFVVDTDETLVTRILTNLASNALKYTNRGGVLVGMRKRQGKVVFEVWDTGPGMTSDHIEWISKSTSGAMVAPDPHRLRGLGLWNSYAFARLLGASLSVASRTGRGTVFTLTLPGPMRPIPKQLARTSRRQLALVGSNATSLEVTKTMIDALGLRCTTFNEPRKFLARLVTTKFKPALVIFDVEQGQEATSVITRIVQSRYPEISVAVVTPDRQSAHATGLLKSGVHILEAPVSSECIATIWSGMTQEKSSGR